ncbi:MAG: T9SS type A sorting domain-containing protein, partial [Cyclobacteriaceae bacterium]|nr:T9SS type A sorting domain-containing protein [Cyclobacteriaceae bacterium]
GVYAVDVTTNGCTTTSSDFVYLITATEFQSADLKVYPNPVSDKLIIETSHDATLSVYDVVGRLRIFHLLNKTSNTIVLDELPHGHYLIKIESHDFKKYIKVQKK